MNVYKNMPALDNGEYALRLTSRTDAGDLLKTYSDEKSVPLFNSDNCHGDDFHYTTEERMLQALDFWTEAYDKGWFVRLSVVDKRSNEVVGTIEGFRREENDHFTDCALLRLDLRSDCENRDKIKSILSLIVPKAFDLFGCGMIATKAIPPAKERIAALLSLGFSRSDLPLVGHDGTEYYDYYEMKRS